ncbi:HlyC/CorC family transporter [Paenibacillus hemerocallicola]|uniref:HlyC/CorC family transporter n=1 Tax=Paenibacillus hemerocallicola TaxID=1172614 RepID=A0A5C4T827_9BACL|nr:HlyC/CorC family transporter [Paenibacillus hemerocallicola]
MLNLSLALVLVLLNGFFVAAEFAMVKARSSRIDALALEGNIRAKFASRILGDMNAYLSACQLGITLTSLALGWLGEPTIARIIEPFLSRMGMPDSFIHIIAFIIGFTIVTSFHITVGEQVPKTYAIRKSEAVTLWAAIPLIIFFKVMYPFIWVLNGASNWMLRKSGIEPESEHDVVHTEEEIRLLVKESHKGGFIDNTELTLVDNVFEFTETVAREIMIPRTELACLYADRSFDENMEIATAEMRTRYPVCDPDKDNIIGFIHIKDILKSRDGLETIRSIVRPIMSIPESMPISTLLKLMQKKRTEVALLIDEYGGTSGLVTMEDILEELVGEIHDEFDEERPSIEKKDELTHSVDGLLHIEEFNDYFGLDIVTDDYDTIGGWVYSQVEIPPKKNQRVEFKGYEMIVEEVDHMRVSRLVVRKTVADNENEVMSVVS